MRENINMEKLYTFRERLKELRLEKNLKLEDMSKLTGLSRSAISRWERGISEPTVSSLIVLAKFFNESLDFMCGLDN